jgi:hypothetical protein
MKNTRFHLVLLALFGLSALTINAAQLASAKVLSVTGIVTNSEESPLAVGAILAQGDSVVTSALSNALLVFSNGSELVVKEKSSVTLAELTQEAFSGKKSYEQLQADPSKSQALLELNYGKVSGHVKKLRPGSTFKIETPLGTAAIRGTKFTVETRYDAARGEYILAIENEDGLVDIISSYVGSLEYGRGNVGDMGYVAAVSYNKSESIPARHKVIIRMSKNDPNYDEIINRVKNYAPFQSVGTQPEVIVVPPIIETDPTAEDVGIISPEA